MAKGGKGKKEEAKKEELKKEGKDEKEEAEDNEKKEVDVIPKKEKEEKEEGSTKTKNKSSSNTKEDKEEVKEGKIQTDLNIPNQKPSSSSGDQVLKIDNKDDTLTEKGKTVDNLALKEDQEDSLIEEKNQLISVKDIIEALSIIIAASRQLQSDSPIDFVTLEHMQIETPQVIEKLDPELFFSGDPAGKWALMWGKQRITKTLNLETVENYPNFIKHLHHVMMGTAKELYRIFRIKTKISQGTRTILDPLCLGFDQSMLNLVKEEMRKITIDHSAFFSYTPMGTYDEHFIVINPALHDIHTRTQDLILDAARSQRLRDWMEKFAERKRYAVDLGGSTIYGSNNTQWFNHSEPMNLPSITEHIPNFNLMSVSYGSPFCVPECTLTRIDLTQMSQTMQINTNRANPLSEIISAPYDSKNYEDFRRIMLALIFPGQIMIDIEMNIHGNSFLAGFTALCAKMLFSTTPNARNISMNSAKEMDIYIMIMLEDLGYSREVQGPALQVNSRQFADAALWHELATREEDGRGWINHGVNCFFRIADPLYNGINTLVMYGGKTDLVNVARIVEAGDVAPAPIIDLILQNLGNASRKQEAAAMHKILKYLSSKYAAFLMSLNQFIGRYGECGFRLTDRMRADMDRLYNVGGLDNNLNAPIRITIQGNSVWKFFLRLPNTFTPNSLVLKQPICESVVSAEIQRIVSVYLSVLDWVQRDGRNDVYVNRRILKLVLESNISNVIAQRIFDYCFHSGDLQRVDLPALRQVANLFDDFEAIVMPLVAEIAYKNLEIFGLTRDVIYKPHEVQIPVGAAFRNATLRGYIQDNSTQRHRYVSLTYLEMERQLGNMNFLSRMKGRNGRNTTTLLPIYMLYRESRTPTWEKETTAWDVSIPDVRIAMARKEVLTPKMFTHQYMLPPIEGPAFPDLFLINGSIFKFWYVGRNQMTVSAAPATIGGSWLATTRSYKDYVIFRSPLDYETAKL